MSLDSDVPDLQGGWVWVSSLTSELQIQSSYNINTYANPVLRLCKLSQSWSCVVLQEGW